MPGPFSSFEGHEQVVFGEDPTSGLRCIVAIHSTQLGPALGGTRYLPYADEQEALDDVLRLSRAMTYKAACAGLDVGGGKAVILGDPAERSESLLRSYGRMIEGLSGRYVTACDVGTTPADMAIIGRETRWATGAAPADGGSGDSGPMTAHGVHLAMRVAVGEAFGDDRLRGRRVAVQGLGKVGSRLVEHLLDDGARVSVADPSPTAVAAFRDRPGVDVVDPDDVLEVEADVVSPNALGGVLDERSIAALRTRVVCGGANNQLSGPGDAQLLAERGILYAPDYVVNAGGLINVADELHPGGHVPERARRRTGTIPATLRRVLETARREDVTPEAAARRVAERRLSAAGAPHRFRLP